MRHPTWDDIRRFCKVEGWTPTHADRGRKRRDHDRYRLELPDGRILRTRASFGKAQIGDPSLVQRILRDQLEVSEEEFWRAVDDGVPPDRPTSGAVQPEQGGEPAHRLPDWLAVNLAVKVGLSDDQIAQLSEEDALQAWNDWCARPSK